MILSAKRISLVSFLLYSSKVFLIWTIITIYKSSNVIFFKECKCKIYTSFKVFVWYRINIYFISTSSKVIYNTLGTLHTKYLPVI